MNTRNVFTRETLNNCIIIIIIICLRYAKTNFVQQQNRLKGYIKNGLVITTYSLF